ncbi:hypothetical protein F7725_006371 [Dissostichus mawsoni]|uniref:TRAPP14 N-terminal domain-containing protein n=1 Tax=Dissostichus mawsoni TaxID=36200 RepID=A0A7J5XVJ9_DISMA|nr:hypothetical protein F7725_006371 [Dissostichus mawsoni]
MLTHTHTHTLSLLLLPVAMVQMMESQCEYFMYFPAVPITDLSDPGRSHLFLGETVRFLLVLRSRGGGTPPDTADGAAAPPSGRSRPAAGPGGICGWLSERRGQRESRGEQPAPGNNHHQNTPEHQNHHDFQSGDEANDDGDDDYIAAAEAAIAALGSRVMVTVWKKEAEKAEVQELGYLSVLQQREPTHTFRHDLNTFKAQVSTTLTVLPPPTKHASIKVVNRSEQNKLKCCSYTSASCRRMIHVFPPPLCSHQSGQVGMASFCRVDSSACRLPSMLSALEEHDFLFQLHLNDTPPDDSNEVPLVAVLQWSTPKMPFTNCIYTHYRLPSLHLDRPRFVMTASAPSTVRVREDFRSDMKLKLQFTASVSNPPLDAGRCHDGQCHGAPGHHPPRRLSGRSASLPSGQISAFCGQDRQRECKVLVLE